MAKRFKANGKYSGEIFYGGCGSMDQNCVKILKRTKGYITYQENFGKAIGKITRVRREYMSKWGEYIAIHEDRFFAFAVETNQIR